jgi:hypothetical protein
MMALRLNTGGRSAVICGALVLLSGQTGRSVGNPRQPIAQCGNVKLAQVLRLEIPKARPIRDCSLFLEWAAASGGIGLLQGDGIPTKCQREVELWDFLVDSSRRAGELLQTKHPRQFHVSSLSLRVRLVFVGDTEPGSFTLSPTCGSGNVLPSH